MDNRVKDAFDMKKTIQEVLCLRDSTLFPDMFIMSGKNGLILEFAFSLQAKYLAEAVGAGMGSSLQGFVGKILQK